MTVRTPFRESHNFERLGSIDYDAVAATLVQDLAGRDFTLNAMAYDPLGEVLHDPHGGQRDLEQRLVRSLPDPLARFAYDPVRILRGIRIAESVRFEIEPETLAAMRVATRSADLRGYRAFRELCRMLASTRPAWCLERLREAGAAEILLAPLAPCLSLPDPVRREGTVWDTLLRALWLMDPSPSMVGWTVLLAAGIESIWLSGDDAGRRDSLPPRNAAAQAAADQSLAAFLRHFPERQRGPDYPDGEELPLDDNPRIARLALEVAARPQDPWSWERAKEVAAAAGTEGYELWKRLARHWVDARADDW